MAMANADVRNAAADVACTAPPFHLTPSPGPLRVIRVTLAVGPSFPDSPRSGHR
jgi:hypothetical protein